MDLGTLIKIIDDAGCEYLSNTPVYVSEVNSIVMNKVIGVQVKKSYADNGTERTWIEIQTEKGIVPNN